MPRRRASVIPESALRPGLSIRTTLILLLSGFTTALLFVLYAAVTWQYSRDQINQVDNFLIRESAAIQADIAPAVAAYNPESAERLKPFQDYIARRVNLPIQYKTTLVITDNLDRVLGASNQALELDLRELVISRASLTDQRSLGAGTFLMTVRHQELTYRLIYQPLAVGKPQLGSIRYACLLDSALANSLAYAGSTALFLALAVALNIGGSIILVFRVLAPVAEMGEAVETIGARNLDRRLPVLPGRDELSRLSITLNRALDRIAKAWRFQEDLVNDLSHQLRTPLTAMRSGLEVALRRDLDAAACREIIEDSITDIDRLNSLITTMLTVARLEGSRSALELAPGDPHGLIERIAEDFRPLWEDNGLAMDIRSELPPGYRAPIDEAWLTQAIVNILDNARNYAPAGSAIELRIAPAPGNTWSLSIANAGPPIPEAELESIFERFHRGAGAHVGSGFGLGLNIARRIAALHGGSLTATNRPGGGVAFTMILPGS